MAYVEQLPSGMWRARYRDSRNILRSAGTFAHKKEAQRKAGSAEDLAREESWSDPESRKRTWGEWADAWWESRSVAASTLKHDETRRKKHLDPRWADVPLGAITRQDVKMWAADLRRGGLGAESVKRCVHLLSASLNSAVDAEIIKANPAARLKLPGGPPMPERYLTREEYAAIRAKLPSKRDQLIADVLVYTGMRWGEMAGLHWSRVLPERGVLTVLEVWDESDGTIKAYPKGKRARTVPVRSDVMARLVEQTRSGKGCGIEHVQGRCVGPLALTTADGDVLRNSNWAYRVWHPAVKAAGIGHVRPHDLRHTFASWLLQEGIPLAEVGKLLGHVSSQTTQRYAHLSETPTDAVLQALEKVG